MATALEDIDGTAAPELWRDASAPEADRVRDLMSRMSLREKVAQLSGLVDLALVDRAVERVLAQKCQLGLLDADWSPQPPILREAEAEAGAGAPTGSQAGSPLDDPSWRNVLSPMVDPTALFPFGHGLSYNPAVWARVQLHGSGTWPTDGTCRVAVTLGNTGTTAVSEVVQVYLHDVVAEVARPVQLLVAAPRVDLAPGTTRTVLIDLHADLTSYTGLAGQRIVDPGEVELWVGASSTDIRATLPVRLTGPRREVGFDRRLQPEVTLVED